MTYPKTATALVRRLNAKTPGIPLWRTRMIDGHRHIEQRLHTSNGGGRWFWRVQGWADDYRDVARLAEDYGVA